MLAINRVYKVTQLTEAESKRWVAELAKVGNTVRTGATAVCAMCCASIAISCISTVIAQWEAVKAAERSSDALFDIANNRTNE